MTQDLFGLAVEVTEDCFSAVYGSGVSAYWDARGTMEAGRYLGVVATDVPDATIVLLRSYAEKGGKSFVDSGAFGAFKRGGMVDFDAILSIYDGILTGLSDNGRRNIAIVMPDVIGDQDASIALCQQYRERIVSFIATGADVIIPIHKGRLPVHEVGELLISMFGPEIRFGIPSNAAALSDQELAKVRHSRFHILGKATLDAKLRRRAYTILEGNPGADLSCDANLIRSRLVDVSQVHKALIGAVDDPFAEVFDDTELIYEVIHGTAWMKKAQIAFIAGLYGISDSVTIQRWVKAHKDVGLEALIEEEDPEGAILYQILPLMFDETAKLSLSAQCRAKAVAQVLAA